MTDRWEYMQVVWGYSDDVKAKYFILRAGRDTEVRDASALKDVDVLAEFGAEGWELVAETILENSLMERKPFGSVGAPLRERWTLKRWIGD